MKKIKIYSPGSEIETVILPGLYRFSIIGINQKNSSDLKDRVYSALRSEKLINLKSDNKKITINFLPASTDKRTGIHDLAIALSCLHQMNQVRLDENIVAVGELSITGSIVPVGILLKTIYQAIKNDIDTLVCSRSDAEVLDTHHSAIADILEENNIKLVCGRTLSEAVENIKNKTYYVFKNKNVSTRQPVVGTLDVVNHNILKVFLAICTKRHIFIENKKGSYIEKYIKNLEYYSTSLCTDEILLMADLLEETDKEIIASQSYPKTTCIDSQTQKNETQNLLNQSFFGFITIKNIAEVAEEVWYEVKKHSKSSIICFYNPCPCGNSNIFFNSLDADKCFCLQRSILRYRQKIRQIENEYFDFYIKDVEQLELPYTPEDYIKFNTLWSNFRRKGNSIKIEDPDKETLEHYRSYEKAELDKLIVIAADIKKLKVMLKNKPFPEKERLVLTKKDIDLAITLTRKGF